jgi:hypothetical protein
MVLLEGALDVFAGSVPSLFMLFRRRMRPEWAARIPALAWGPSLIRRAPGRDGVSGR